jgi:hypothetical protein
MKAFGGGWPMQQGSITAKGTGHDFQRNAKSPLVGGDFSTDHVDRALAVRYLGGDIDTCSAPDCSLEKSVRAPDRMIDRRRIIPKQHAPVIHGYRLIETIMEVIAVH